MKEICTYKHGKYCIHVQESGAPEGGRVTRDGGHGEDVAGARK